MTTPAAPVTVGLDIAKAWVDVCLLPTDEQWRITQTSRAWQQLATTLLALQPERIVLEASGGYERGLYQALDAAGLPVAPVNPRNVRQFARAMGHLAKTDQLDAALLARYGQQIQPAIRAFPSAAQQLLTALVTRRRQLVKQRVAEHNRLETLHPQLQAGIEAHLQWLDGAIAALDVEIAQLLEQPAWQQIRQVLESVPGVGPVVTSTLLAELPELGMVSGKQVAAVVGVAPFNTDSGYWRGSRHVWGGRATVRRQLYMAVVSGLRYNPMIRAVYQRLRARGKPVKVAMVACMRKLVVLCNALVRDGTVFDASRFATS